MVRDTFEDIRKALDIRENLLLRQIDVLASQQHHPYQIRNHYQPIIEQINFSTNNKDDILSSIRAFGKFNLDECTVLSESITEQSFNEKIGSNSPEENEVPFSNLPENICMDFTADEVLIRENVNLLNDSIVNITLNESKELIENVKLGYCNESYIDQIKATLSMEPEVIEIIERDVSETKENEEDIDDVRNNNNNNVDECVISNLTTNINEKTASKKEEKTNNHFCTGVINLKNISNLTINTNCFETHGCACSEHSDDTAKPSVTLHKECERNAEKQERSRKYQCEFYNKLINNIRNSFAQISDKKLTSAKVTTSNTKSSLSNTSFTESTSHLNSNTSTKEKHSSEVNGCNKILFKNIRNLKINIPINSHATKTKEKNSSNLKANMKNVDDYERPIQIEDWLRQIISETEIEPIQNLEILEHSQIHNNSL